MEVGCSLPSHLIQTWTGRLVPVEYLREPDFSTRNRGGWTPIYLGVIEVAGTAAGKWQEDPLLQQARQLEVYGSRIRALRADREQVAARLQSEAGEDVDGVARGLA